MEDYTDETPAVEDTNQGSKVTFWHSPPDPHTLKDQGDLALVGGERTTRLTMYDVYENFYNGNQLSELSARAAEYLGQVEGVDYAENVCDLVVDAMANRMTIKKFTSDPENQGVTDKVTEIWDYNNMDETGKVAVSRTIELGDGFLVVDYCPEEKMPTISFNPPEMMKAEYDPSDPQKMVYAVKRWVDTKITSNSADDVWRMNVYYPNRIERYFAMQDGADWLPYTDDDETQWPIPWTRDNKPPTDVAEDTGRGIPVFHLKNNPRGKTYGRSEIHKVIPLQTSLNKLWLDLFEVADKLGFPQRWVTGMTKPEAEALIAGELWSTTIPEAKMGQFDAADLNQFVNLIDTRYRTIAGKTSTPIHMMVLAKGVLSGEALKKSEAGLVSKIKDRQPSLGHQFSEAIMMCLMLLVDNGIPVSGFKTGEGATKLTPQWTEAENVDEKEKLETAESKRRIGVPLKRVLQELGYDDVEELMKLIEEETQKNMDMQLALSKANKTGETGKGNLAENADGKRKLNENADGKAKGQQGQEKNKDAQQKRSKNVR